jgi:lipopolysaccharide export system permease protein
MRLVDRYLIREMAGPFLFGMGAFATVLVGVDLLYDALRMIFQLHLPPGPVLQAIFYRLPQTIVLTLPMATIFSTLMCFGNLSAHGEVAALRAGGIGLWRLAVPALLVGLVVSLSSLYLNGWLVPHANSASESLLAGLQKTARAQRDLVLRIPDTDSPDRVLLAKAFDPQTGTLDTLIIWEFKQGKPDTTYAADSARWVGDTWELRGVRYARPGGVTLTVPALRYRLGKAPWEIAQAKRRPREMTMAELRRLIGLAQTSDAQLAREAREELALRLSVPWAALGLVLVGLPLGLRPQRTSTGVGLGLSLAIILAYYIVLSLMRILGQQGALPPTLADWIPNLLLYTIGAGLLFNASR